MVGLMGCNRTVGCHRRYDISRIQWKAMDNEEQPCDEEGASVNTRRCISNFIRDRVGCYIPMQDMEPGGKPKCDQLGQFNDILSLTLQLSLTDSDLEIYKLTGCLSSCNKVLKVFMLMALPVLNLTIWQKKCYEECR